MSRARARALVAGLALAAGCGSPPISEETRARERFLRELVAREGLPEAWGLLDRAELVFQDGFSLPDLAAPDQPPGWRDQAAPLTSVRSRPVRWMHAQAHLRVRGVGPHRLELRGRVHAEVMATRPRLTVSFDGLEVASLVVDPDGTFAIATAIPARWLDGWCDIYLRLSSVHEPWRTMRDLRIARLEHVAWAPLP